MIMHARLAGALLPLLLLVGCGGEPSPAPDKQQVERWSLEKVTEIDPAQDSLFANLMSITADGDGNVYVAGGGGGGIHVYRPDGTPFRVLGRQGSGPGEFRHKYSIAWLGDTLAVFDPGNGRIELLDRAGQWVASRPSARISGGDVRFFQAGPDVIYAPGTVPDSTGVRLALIGQTRTGTGDTLVPPPSTVSEPYQVSCMVPGGSIHFWRVTDEPHAAASVSPAGHLAVWRSDQDRVDFIRKDGGMVRSIAVGQPPVPIPDSTWDAQLADFRKWRAELHAPECDNVEPKRPPTRTLIQSVEFDDQGRTWVEGLQQDSMTLALFDSTGQLLATIPSSARDVRVPFVVRRDHLYEVQQDSDGAQRVVVWEVRR